ncbi:MAG: hypothetical protein ABIH76_03995 [Candidatus Bathyarchaeota archaeon]
MDWKGVTSDDGAGRFHIELSKTDPWPSYYKTIDCFRILLENPQFQRYVSGYYVNSLHDTVPRIFRLVYLTPPDMRKDAEREIETFILENNFTETSDPDFPRRRPGSDTLAAAYGGPKFELEFRQFLA